uniref:SMB domain-containing protein n=1 Tax=Globodera rostochiensis TaxID=31243 RepID=A0A914H3N2_GLORO
MLLASLFLLLLKLLLVYCSPSFRQLHLPLALLQVFFLLPKRVILANDERHSHPQQYHHQPALPVPQLGCFRFGQPLCCEARNMSCKSMQDSGRSILSFVPRDDRVREVRFGNNCIGKVVLPNFVSLNERGVQILHQLGQREHFGLYSGRRRKNVATFTDFDVPEEEETVIQFGSEAQMRERMDDDQSEEDEKHSPIVRYSLLSRYLPLRIVKRRIRVPNKVSQSAQPEEWTASEPWRMNILMEANMDCFCDQFCTDYGDCCANYAQACPAIDCEVSEWSEWTECSADDGFCGIGTRGRGRAVVRERMHAGRNPAGINAFLQCLTSPPWLCCLTTSTTAPEGRGGSTKTTPSIQQRRHGAKKEANVQYCVHYRIVWLNQECTDEKRWKSKLRPGNVICAECQPEAQFHRSVSRCASDLEDGHSGFWKLIGPKYCYGIWHRLYSSGSSPPSSDCKCDKRFPQLSPFLLFVPLLFQRLFHQLAQQCQIEYCSHLLLADYSPFTHPIAPYFNF